MGRLYGLGFDFDSRWMYCSKFVHRIYREALGLDLGRIQTFRELLDENPGANLNFWRFWYFGRIPWERRTLTPESLYQDEQLFTAFESY